MIENLKISADSAFLFSPLESKLKHEIGGISRKGQFKPRESKKSKCVCKYIDFEVI